jgi:hypothetical protein
MKSSNFIFLKIVFVLILFSLIVSTHTLVRNRRYESANERID